MTPEEQAHKLDMIRSLPAGELTGWHRYCTVWRQPFPGELAALHQRAKVLGMTLPSSSPAVPSDCQTATRMPPTDTSGSI